MLDTRRDTLNPQDKDAHEAARFYAATFPDSQVTAVRAAPGPTAQHWTEQRHSAEELASPCGPHRTPDSAESVYRQRHCSFTNRHVSTVHFVGVQTITPTAL